MSFSIDIQPLFNFHRIRITDNSIAVHIDIISKGGLLNSWIQRPANNFWDVIEGNNFEAGWGLFEANGFKSGKMSPFSCRLHKGEFIHEDKTYKLNKFYLGNHALHGVIYDAPFEIVSTEIQPEKASVLLEYNHQTSQEGFPFNYTIQLLWTLCKENKVTITTHIINKGQSSFPIMDGWHPYFKLGNTIDECTLQFFNNGILAYDDELIPTGKINPDPQFEKPKNLTGIELDNGYHLASHNTMCILENEQYQLIVSPSAAYAYLQLYTPPGRKSIAIENLSGAPDCFNNKMGLHIMQPQDIWTLETSYQVRYK
jgi:aldose 1-epimerase